MSSDRQAPLPLRFCSDLCSTFLWLVLGIWTVSIVGFNFIPANLLPNSKKRWHRVAQIWGIVLTRFLCINISLKNRENLYREGSSIILCNHQSYADIPIIYAAINLPFVWMIKKSLYSIPLFGWVLKAAGYIPVDRDDKKDAGNSLYKMAEAISTSQSSVLIFPEGTHGHLDGTMRPFKGGAFLLAKKCKTVIQPVTINNSNQVLSKRRKGYLMMTFTPFVPVEVIFHPPLYLKDYEKMKTKDLMKKVEMIIGSAIRENKSSQ